uniref:Uncharacterized protein n=1 Tax=Candidatus Methanophagaceae archaeon ANME-1 ERB6 TaxID=2759912 RepID=A0A7G9YSI0_9EURY|nr:hypothetical protein BBGANOMO_00038 [Methanosarcinales archaeon ANME-1 ERB6]
MIPESSSLVANILLKRIETEKSKFEELYADLDILEENITEKGYHFPSLEKPLRENFEQFKPKIEDFANIPINATLKVIKDESEWRTALLHKFTDEIPNELRETYMKLFENVYLSPSLSSNLVKLIQQDPIKFSISARTLHSDIGFLNEMSGFCCKRSIFIYEGGMRKETLANCARYLDEGKSLRETFTNALRFEDGFVLNLTVHELAHAQVPELYEKDVEQKKEILSMEEEFYHELTSNAMNVLINKINPQFANLTDLEKILTITIAVLSVNVSELPKPDATYAYPFQETKSKDLELTTRAENLKAKITTLVERRSVLGALIEGYSAFVSERLLNTDKNYTFFKEERDRNLEKIQAPSAIKREVTGARYGSDLIQQLYQKHGKKGLEIVLKRPPESYNELTDLSSYMNKISFSQYLSFL